MVEIYTPFALKLYSYGLSRLLDLNWAETDLVDNTLEHLYGRKEPYELLKKPLKNGFLFHLGRWLYSDYINFPNGLYLIPMDIARYIEDLFMLLINAGVCSKKDRYISPILLRLERIYTRYYITQEAEYYSKHKDYRYNPEKLREYTSDDLRDIYDILFWNYKSEIVKLTDIYAANYADRIFHDRELCAYISQLLINFGIAGKKSDGELCQWIDRVTIPEWVKASLRARERGKCAMCGTDLVFELEDDYHIDHIVPLSKGGCNDLLNLQLLCKTCNLEKSNSDIPVNSSIPLYMRRHIKK